MLCQICHSQEASVYLIESVENSRTSLHICENCAQKRHVGDVLNKSSLMMQQLLGSLSPLDNAQDRKFTELKCPGCGLTLAAFRQNGRLGCERCYDVFKKPLLPLLRRFHQAEEHRGQSGQAPAESPETLDSRELKEKIRKAVAEEDFELAARLRDQLKRKPGKGGI